MTEPSKESVSRLLDILENLLNTRDIRMEIGIQDLFPSSIQILNFLRIVADEFQVRITISSLLARPTLSGLLESIAELQSSDHTTGAVGHAGDDLVGSRAPVAGGQKQSGGPRKDCLSELIPLQESGAGYPLFIVPGGGGNPMIFREVAGLFQKERPVHALVPKPLTASSITRYNLQELAASYLEEIRAYQEVGPYHILGFCFGGLVAFEMVQQLQVRGESIGLLGLIETPMPSTVADRNGGKPSWSGSALRKFLRHLRQIPLQNAGDGFTYIWERLEGRFTVVRRWWRKRSYRDRVRFGQPMTPEMAEQLLLDSDEELFWTFNPKVCHSELHLFWMEQDPPWSGKTRHRRLYDPDVARAEWARYTSKRLIYHQLPGDHLSIFRQPYVDSLATTLKAVLPKGRIEGDGQGPTKKVLGNTYI